MGAGDRGHERSVRLPAAYVAEHTHLAYAVTAYGVQSATAPAAHTVLGDALDGAGLYVGMTRGRHCDTLHVVAADLAEAREQFAAALQRDRADRGLTDATRSERERQAQVVVAAADAHLVDVRATVGAPLIEQATADGAGYLTARERMWQAHRALSTTGRFGRRPAARAAREATEAHGTMQDAVRQRWRDVPHTATHLPFWAGAVAEQLVRADPRVVEAQQEAERFARAAERAGWHSPSPVYPSYPERGFGPSL